MKSRFTFQFVVNLVLSALLFLPLLVLGQASVSYSPPSYYLQGQAITNLSPTQNGVTINGGTFTQVTNFTGTSLAAGSTAGSEINGLIASSTFKTPRGIVKDALGNYYVTEVSGKRIRKISSAGSVTTVYQFATLEPRDLAINTTNGDLYVIVHDDQLLKLSNTNSANYPTQQPSYSTPVTVAGSSTAGSVDATGTNARFNNPWGLAMSSNNSYLLVADYGNNKIRKVTLSSMDVTSYFSTSLSGPTDIHIVNDNLMYVAEYSSNQISKIENGSTISVLASGAYTNGNFDGTGAAALLDQPHQLTADALGNVYVVERYNHKVRKITTDGKVSTLAGGMWDNTYSGDVLGNNINARFKYPSGIFFDAEGGFLLVADTDNHRIKKIQLEGFQIIPEPASGLVFNSATGELSGTPTAYTLKEHYIHSFNSASLGTVNGTAVTLTGNASVIGDYLMLTERNNDKKGGITIPSSGLNVTPLYVAFEAISTKTSGAADGFSYSFGPDVDAAATSPTAEIGTGTKLTVSFSNFSGNSRGIRIFYNPASNQSLTTTVGSTMLAYSSNLSWMGTRSKVTISVNESGQLTLTLNGVVLFNNIQLPADYLTSNKSTWKHVLKARTGGDNDLMAIDNLAILHGYGTTTHKVIARDNTLYQEANLAVNVPVLPTLTTTSISSITTSGAAVNYTVNSLGSSTISGSGIVWGASSAPTLSVNLGTVASGSTSTGSLSSNITGLNNQTVYYARSYVTTSLGHTVYGNELSFTTLLAVPEISYNQTNSFISGVSITPVLVTNSGGVVVAGNSGIVSTIAGSGVEGGTNGMSISAQFKSPEYIVIDSQGNKFISEGWGHRIRKITPDGTVSTFAGSTQGDVLGTGTAAKFSYPTNMAIDANDNIFVVDYSNGKIKKITPAGVVTTFVSGLYTPAGIVFDAAGNLVVVDRQAHIIRKYTPQGVASVFVGSGTSGTNNGTGAAAQFNYPSSIVKDANDNFYVAEYNRIRKITAQGVVTTLAGGTTYGATNGTGTAAGFGYINGLAISPAGDLYVSDGSKIRKITPAGVVTTYIGNSWGYLDGALDVALFKTPYGLEFDQNGNLIVVDRNDYRIRQIAPPSIGSFTVSPTLPAGLTLNSNGSISGTPLVASAATNYTVTATNSAGSDTYTLSIEVLTSPTVVTNILSNATPTSVTAGGNLLNDGNANLEAVGICWSTSPLPTIANTIVSASSIATGNFSVTVSGLSANQTYYFRAYSTNSVGTTYGDQVIYTPSILSAPNISYNATNVIDLQVATTITATNTGGAVSSTSTPQIPVIAGSTVGNVNATGTAAQFGYLTGIEKDNEGNFIIADFNNHQIKKVTPAGVVTTIAGTGVSGSADGSVATATFYRPYDVAVDLDGNIYVSDFYNHRIRKITPAGVVSTLAGSSGGYADGTGTAAKFLYPRGIDVDEKGNVYVADEYNYSIRKITPQGVVTTVAGSTSSGNQDGTGAAAKFSRPMDISLDPSGNMFVTDYYNHSIRKITPAGVVSTFAGSQTTLSGSESAISYPMGIKVDDFGNVLFSEYYWKIRKLTATGVISTPSTGASISANGVNSINNPLGLTLDNSGGIYFTDGGNTTPVLKKLEAATTGSWSISPALPAGLSIGTNGNITGTPYVTSTATNYTVTATNATGSGTYTLSIEITGPTNDQINLTETISNITEETVDVSATLSTGGSVVVLQNDPYHLVSYGSTANLGTIYQITLTGQIASGTVWGTNNIYTHDSRISKAAVHAGILDDGETGTVYVQLTPGLPSYGASTENGVTTYTWPSWPYTYSFVNAPSSPTTPVTAKGFVYATTTTPELGGQGVQSVAVSTGTTSFNTTLTGLTPAQTYYVRAYATNTSGTYYSAQQTFTTADITYADVNTTYGAANATIQVPNGVGTTSITYSSSNSGVVSVSGPIMTFGNAGTAIITATQAAYGSYGAITNTFNVTVAKANQSLSMQLNNGNNTALPQTQALSNLTGSNFMQIAVSSKYMLGMTLSNTSLEPTLTMDVSSPTTAVLTDLTTPYLYTFGNVANSQSTSTVTFTLTHPGNSNFNPATITHTMDITNDIGVITFNQPVALTYPVSLGVDLVGYATSTSTAPIVYSVVSGPGSISNNILTVTGAGTIVLQAAQPTANTIPVNQNLVINKGVPVYTFANMTKTYGDANFTPSYVSSSDGTVTFSSSNSNVATTGGSVIDVLNAGTTTITLSQTEGTNYVAAAATATLTVNKASQTINYTSVSPITTYDFYFNPIVLPTESSAGLPLTYSTSAFTGFSYGSQGPIGSISSNLLSFDETAFINGNYTGSVMLTISQAGNDNYLAAEITENISVSRIQSVITATDLSTSTAQIGGALPYAATTNASFPGQTYPISVASSNTNVATYNASTGMLEIIGAGTTWITATHMADAYYTTGMHTQMLSITALSTPTISASTQYPCAGQTLQDLNVQTNIGMAILKWYDAATGGNELPVTEVLANGTYWVSQFLNNQESSRSAVAVVITDISTATLSAISGSSTATPGTPLVLSVTQINGATSYVWDLPAGLTIASSANNGAAITVTVSNSYATGIVKVKALNSCGETAWQTKTVYAPGQAGISITTTHSGAPVICGGATSVPFSVTSATGATYAWTLPTGLSFAAGYDGDEQTTYVNFAVGYVGGAITCTRSTATATNTASYSVGGLATPGSISGLTVLCDVTTETYSIGSVPNATSYQWQLPTGMSGTSTTNSITATWTGSVSGTVQVRATGTCGTSAWRTLSVGPVATPSGITGPTIICGAATYTITGSTMTQVSQTTLNYSVTNVAGINYAWTVPTGMTITSGGTSNAIVVEVDPSTFTSGQVSVTAINQTSNTCASSARTLAVSKSVSAITGPTAICGLTSATYSVPSGSGTSFTWTVPSWMTITSGSGTNSINVSIATTGTSTQSLSVEIETSCGDVTVSRSVGCGTFTQIQQSQCGGTIANSSTTVNANWIGAGTYRFHVSGGTLGAAVIVDKTWNGFQFGDVTGALPGTYSVKVDFKPTGASNFLGYGATCSLILDSQIPTTAIATAQCGTTIASTNTTVNCTWVGPGTYRFEVSGGNLPTAVTVDKTWNGFQFADVTGALPGNYSVAVSFKPTGYTNFGTATTCSSITLGTSIPTTAIATSQCGTTIASTNTVVNSTWVGPGTYRFEVSGGNLSSAVTVDKTWNGFQFADVTGALPGNYSVAVSFKPSGQAAFGAATTCNSITLGTSIPTPAIATTQCGTTIASTNTTVNCTWVGPGTYRFVVSGGTLSSAVTVDKTWNGFQFADVTGALPGNYSVAVSFKPTGQAAFGAATTCNSITLGSDIPTTAIATTQCTNGVTSASTVVNCTWVGPGTYRFVVSGGTLSAAVTLDKTWNGFQFSNIPGASYGGYTVSVSFRPTGYTTFGDPMTCEGLELVNAGALAQQDPQLHEEQTEGLGVEESSNVNGMEENQIQNTTWSATATSNPFATSFQIKLNGAEGISSAASFTAQLTDMSGKVYSQATLNKELLESESFGEQLAPGMYLMTLRQGEELRVIRVVKR